MSDLNQNDLPELETQNCFFVCFSLDVPTVMVEQNPFISPQETGTSG